MQRLRGEITRKRARRVCQCRLRIRAKYNGVVCIDESRDRLIARVHAQRCRIGERNIQQSVQRVRTVCRMAGAGCVRRQLRAEFGRIRLVVNDPNRTGDGARTIEGALRPAQHLDALHVR